MSVLEKLTEGIVRRDVSKEGQALLAKWEKTGLLEGITNESQKNGMAVLLENQAKELLSVFHLLNVQVCQRQREMAQLYEMAV